MSPDETAVPGQRGHGDPLRQKVVIATAVLGGVTCLVFSMLESRSSDFDSVERYALPGVGLYFIAMAWLARRRHFDWAAWGIVSAGAFLLLERVHFVLASQQPELVRMLHAYEMLAWFVCLYLYVFLLLDKRWALLFSLAMLGASMLIVQRSLSAGFSGAHPIDVHEFYASQLFCLGFIYMLSSLKEHYVATQREAAALRTYAETDFLTGVANRRSLTDLLVRELCRCERSKGRLALILLDVDRFKDVNDTLGHDEGDRTLRRIAMVVDRSRRRSDLFGRWGGEEFLLVAPDLDLEGGRLAAERMREVIEQSSKNTRAPITASFGVAEYVPGDDVASLVRRADQALIHAKSRGRNRVEAQAA